MTRLLFIVLAVLAGIAMFVTPSLRSASASIARLPAQTLHPSQEAIRFLLPTPAGVGDAEQIKVWATWYNLPTVQPAAEGDATAAPLLGRKGLPISPPLARADWCNAAMQGSVKVVDASGATTSYVFIDDDGPVQPVDCDADFGNLSPAIKAATRRARFAAYRHPHGCDVRPTPILAYRTIAADPARIPMGTVLYVPALKDRGFWADGQFFTHDGFLVAADRGGAIRDSHIDLFVGERDTTPFPDLIASSAGAKMEAYVVPRTHPAARALKAGFTELCSDVRGRAGKPSSPA